MKYLYFILSSLFLLSCNSGDKTENDSVKEKESIVVNDDVITGGTLNMPIDDPLTTLNPRDILDLTSAKIAGQVFDGLVAYDPKTMLIVPDLAKDWTTSEDLKTYTFNLREDVFFHTENGDKGNKMTANDFLGSVKYYCKEDQKPSIAYSQLYSYIKGAKEFKDGSSKEISGIIVEGNTITVELLQPSATFIFKLANIYGSILSPEVYNGDVFKPLGTGPFIFTENNDSQTILAKNENYFKVDKKGNKLPYLDSVKFLVIASSHKQLESFEAGELHLIEGLPINKVTEVMDEKKDQLQGIPPEIILVNEPEMSTQYYALNTANEVLSNKKVRQAINYAIDRSRIVERVLNNQAYEAGIYGITPPLNVLKGYDFDAIQKSSYNYDPEKAKKLLAEAGFPNGKNIIPTLKLTFNKGSIHSLVASDVATQLRKNLNINLEIEGVSFKQKLEDASYGKGDIFRAAWVADYPSPETFLLNVYGADVPEDPKGYSYPNTSRYKNPEFDALMDQASITKDQAERYKYFAEAEKLMMEDAPFVILWYQEIFKMIYSKVRNFEFNALNYMDLTEVYLKDWTEEEYRTVHKIK